MKRNGLTNKRILGVSGRNEVLRILADKIKDGLSKCQFDGVRSAEEASRSVMLSSYHLLIVDETNFTKIAHTGSSSIKNFPLVILTENDKLPADQNKFFAPNVYGYLSANRPEDIIPILSRLLSIEFAPR